MHTNSDIGQAYFGNHYILDNYCAVQDAFNLNVEEWDGIAKACIRGSWCSSERTRELLIRLETVMSEWNHQKG